MTGRESKATIQRRHAASLAVDSIPKEKEDKFRERLCGYRSISLRENNLEDKIRELSNAEVCTVLDLFTWASTYKGASFERRQAILKQFIKEVRVGRDYNIEIVLNVPLDEFEEFKRHAASAGRGKNQKNKSQNPQKVGRCTSNAGIVVLDKTAGETISIVPKNAAHAILRC